MPFDPAQINARANGACELCGASDELAVIALLPSDARAICLCPACASQLEGEAAPDPAHLRCLNDAMWNEHDDIKIAAYRLLHSLANAGEVWAREALDIIYLEDDALADAQAGLPADAATAGDTHRDSNGAELAAGDTVHLIKDLPVKGAGFTAKRGTAVRNISLVPDEPGQIEGRVNGQHIVILTKFVKRST